MDGAVLAWEEYSSGGGGGGGKSGGAGPNPARWGSSLTPLASYLLPLLPFRASRPQFLSINGRPVRESAILPALTSLFGRSLLCQAADAPSDAGEARHPSAFPFHTLATAVTRATRSSCTVSNAKPFLSLSAPGAAALRGRRRKRLSRYAIYALELSVAKSASDAAVEPTKRSVLLDDEAAAVAFVLRTITGFLQRHFLLPENPTAAEADASAAPSDDNAGPAAATHDTAAEPALTPQLADELSLLARGPAGGAGGLSRRGLHAPSPAAAAFPSTPGAHSGHRLSGKRIYSSSRHASAAATLVSQSDRPAEEQQPPAANAAAAASLAEPPPHSQPQPQAKRAHRLSWQTAGVARKPFWQRQTASRATPNMDERRADDAEAAAADAQEVLEGDAQQSSDDGDADERVQAAPGPEEKAGGLAVVCRARCVRTGPTHSVSSRPAVALGCACAGLRVGRHHGLCHNRPEPDFGKDSQVRTMQAWLVWARGEMAYCLRCNLSVLQLAIPAPSQSPREAVRQIRSGSRPGTTATKHKEV